MSQWSFSKGELSPSLHARVDLDLHGQGLETCRNFIIKDTGGAENRPGTQYVCEVKDSNAATRIIPFEFNTSQTYVLELGNLYMRFVAQGAQIDSGGSPYEISTDYLTADLFKIKYVQNADVMSLVHRSYPPEKLSRTGAASWVISEYDLKNGPYGNSNGDARLGIAIEENGASPPNIGDNVNVYDAAGSFVAGHVGSRIRIYARSSVRKAWAASTGFDLNDIVRSNSKTYKLIAKNSETSSGTIAPDHTEGFLDDGKFTWEYQDSGYADLRITSVTDANNAVAKPINNVPNRLLATLVSLSVSSISKADPAVVTATSHGLSAGAFIKITNTGSLTGFDDGYYMVSSVPNGNSLVIAYLDGTLVDLSGETGTWSGNAWKFTNNAQPSNNYQIEAFSSVSGYPGAVTYYSDRLIFASTTNQPQTYWMSRTSIYDDHGINVPLQDDDAINKTINARQINEIRDMIPLSKLLFMTSGGEWVTTEGETEIVSPTTVGNRIQSFRGSSDVRALVIGNGAVHVQASGKAIYDLFKTDTGLYEGREVSITAEHLFKDTEVMDWAYQQFPNSVVWVVMADGSLVSMTYMPAENIIAFSRHDTGDGDSFESVAVVREGNEDVPYFVVNRTVNGSTKRYIEKLNSREFIDIEDAKFLDSALSYDGTNTTSTTMTISGIHWVQVGNAYLISSSGSPSVTALNETDVAFIDSDNEELRTYRFDGTNWSQVGNSFSIPGVGVPELTTLTATDVAFIDADNDELKTFRWDGADWSQVGNSLSISIGNPAIAALNSTDIALTDGNNDELRTYRFDGTDWAQVGSSLSLSNFGSPALTAINSTDVVLADNFNDELTAYRWDGSSWSQIGSALSVDIGSPALTTLNSTDVVLMDTAGPALEIYRFDGSSFTEIDNSYPIPGTDVPELTALNATDVVLIDRTNDRLTVYRNVDPAWTYNEELTLTASASSFVAGDVGDWLEMTVGDDSVRLEITAYTSDTVVTVRPKKTVPAGIRETATDSWCFYRYSFSNLDHLEGRTVGALVDGNDAGTFTVSSGQITLTTPGCKVHVGLPITADLETLEINSQRANTRSVPKNIPYLNVLVEETRGIFAGPNANQLREYKQRLFENYESPITPKTGTARIAVESDWEQEGKVFIRQSAPLPATILAIVPEVEYGD